MKRLTVAGRLLITALIIGVLYAGYKYLGGEQALEKAASKNTESSPYKVPEPNLPDTEASANSTSPATSPSGSGSSFTYTPPAPVNPVLKGVVELGASGFNSFIVHVDNEKRWKLEKSEFGNSLVTENMATDEDIRTGLKKYIGGMLDFGVGAKNIHFVVSSGAAKADVTAKITKVLKGMGYVVNQVTPEKEGELALRSVLPPSYNNKAFVVDIGSGNTKISWIQGNKVDAIESYGAKYFQSGTDDKKVYDEVFAKSKQIPSTLRSTCFVIGGVPFELAKQVRKGKERYTILNAPGNYSVENAKSKAGINIYKAIADATQAEQFIFDWDANFTIGFLLSLP